MNFLYLLFYHTLALAQFYDQPSKDRYDYCMSVVNRSMSDTAVERRYGEDAQGKCTFYYCEVSGSDLGKSIYAWGEYRSCPTLRRLRSYETKKTQSNEAEVTAFLNRFRETVEVKKEAVLIPPPQHKEEEKKVETASVIQKRIVTESKPNEAIVSQDYNKDTLTCSPENVDTHKKEEYVDLSDDVDDVEKWERKETSLERFNRREQRERIIIDDYDDFYWNRSQQYDSCYNYCFQNQWQGQWQNQYWQGPYQQPFYYQNSFNPFMNYNPYMGLNLSLGVGWGGNNQNYFLGPQRPYFWGF